MADKSVDLPVTVENSNFGGGNSRRKSMGKASTPDRGEPVVPHYLRTSTGSCHDICKYGGKHAFEDKPKRSVPKRAGRRPHDGQSPLESVVALEMNRKLKGNKEKPSPDSKSLIADPMQSAKLGESRASPGSRPLAESKRPDERKATPVTGSKSSPSSKIRKSHAPGTRKADVSLSSGKTQVLSEKGLSDGKEMKVLAKLEPFLSPKPMKVKPLRSSASSGNSNAKSNSSAERSRSSRGSKGVPKKASAPVSISLSPQTSNGSARVKARNQKSQKAVSLKNQSKIGADSKQDKDDEVAEKTIVSCADPSKIGTELELGNDLEFLERTLHVIKVDSGSKAVESEEKGHGAVEFTSNSFSSEDAAAQSFPIPDSPLPSTCQVEDHVESEITVKENGNSFVLHAPNSPSSADSTLISSSVPNSPSLSTPEEEAHGEAEYTVKETGNSAVEYTPNSLLSADSVSKSSVPNSPSLSAPEVEAHGEGDYTVKETGSFAVEYSPNSPLSTDSVSKSSSANSPSLSAQEEDDHSESENTVDEEDEYISDDIETGSYEAEEDSNGKETSDANYKSRPRRTLHPEDNNCSPSKLNFRRGKVVDLQTHNNSPRRLKFRRGRVLGENQTAKDPHRKVVLRRHQGAQGKKDAQSLLNNVIEETASKLVETRKSKVKALVGAFETVISLQENKPVATAED